MSKILLSICISSYNKGERCCKLVKNILSIRDERYNIYICDDSSDEDTLVKINSIHEDKVNVLINRQNLGPCKNWFQTIDCGDGEYILHVLDRDDIEVKRIEEILDILENNTIGGGYIGTSAIHCLNELCGKEHYDILNHGEQAFVSMAGVPIHPTGFLVKRDEWRNICCKKFFYQEEKYGIYPHSYVLGVISLKKDMLIMPVKFCKCIYSGESKRSRFYEKKTQKNYWWLPQNVMKTSNQMILYLHQYVIDKAWNEKFVCRRFSEGLQRATITYKNTVGNSMEMAHYGLQAINISTSELVWVSLKYIIVFIHILKKIDTTGWKTLMSILKSWIMNMRDIWICRN